MFVMDRTNSIQRYSDSCVFCKILQGVIPCKKVYETEFSLVVEDIHPKAPIHYLIIPKIHIENLNFYKPELADYCNDVVVVAKFLADNKLGAVKAFNLVSNHGIESGQSVLHLHWHFLAGKNIYGGGFSL